MFLKSLFVLASSVGIAHGCSCREPKVQFKMDHSDVVFRGTLIELRDSEVDHFLPFVRDTRKIAVFRVARVWKGDVGPIFEMPAVEETSVCVGFNPDALRLGTDLLIYADRSRLPGHQDVYYTSICGFHKVACGSKDLRKLGRGKDPLKQNSAE